MENQGRILNFWQQGDVISQMVTLLLLGMSVLSWIVILFKAWNMLQLHRMKPQVAVFWKNGPVQERLTQWSHIHPQAAGGNPFYRLAWQGHEALEHHRATSDQGNAVWDASEWVSRGLRQAMSEASATLQSGLAVLASIASTAPFVGLFGTVWGIYHALIGMGTAGALRMDRISGPMGEALIMTALGLAVAVPAVLGHNALVRANQSVMRKLDVFAHELHAYFITGKRLQTSALKG